MFSNTDSVNTNGYTFNKFINYLRHLKYRIQLKSIPYIGIICAAISVIFWSTAALCVKLSTDVHALEVLTFGAIIQGFVYLLAILYQRQEYFGDKNERIYLILRCTLGTVSMGCLYTSFRLIPLSDATTIRYTAPVFVSVFAFILLREPFGRIDMLNAVLTIVGVVLVGHPSFLYDHNGVLSKHTIIGLVLALSSAISIAISMTVMRKLQKTNASVVIFWFSITTIVLGTSSLWLLDEYKWPSNGTVWLIIVINGLCGATDQLFITLALKWEKAGPVAMVRALNVVFSFIFSATILNEKIRITSFIGGGLIFLSICIVSGCKSYTESNSEEQQPILSDTDEHPSDIQGDSVPVHPKHVSYVERNRTSLAGIL